MKGVKKVYALYRGESFLDEGTLDEIAARRKINRESLRFLKTPAYLKRRDAHKDYGNRLSLIELEGEYCV